MSQTPTLPTGGAAASATAGFDVINPAAGELVPLLASEQGRPLRALTWQVHGTADWLRCLRSGRSASKCVRERTNKA